MTTLGFYCLNNPRRRREYVELQQMLLVVQNDGLLPVISY